MNNSNFTIITFYQFKRINDPAILKEELKKFCSFNKMRGTTIIAKEGINGTISGKNNDLLNIKKKLKKIILTINSCLLID